jgi:hypothetical protein
MENEKVLPQVGKSYRIVDIHPEDSTYITREEYIGKLIAIDTTKFPVIEWKRLPGWLGVSGIIEGDPHIRTFIAVKLEPVEMTPTESYHAAQEALAKAAEVLKAFEGHEVCGDLPIVKNDGILALREIKFA